MMTNFGKRLNGEIRRANQVLTPLQLKKLSEHKYNCDSKSLLDPFLQPYWNWLVKQVPVWMAPNFITISGLLVNVVTSLILFFYSPDGVHPPPRWACLLCAAGIFIYQSLDAIDGKQARRTGSSSPLGELFDHGCDAISSVFISIAACIAVKLGEYPGWMFFQCFSAMALFYCSHWQTYVTGQMRFGRFDVTEAQWGLIGLHVISGLFGADIWSTKFPIPGIPDFTLAIFIVTGLVSVICILGYLRVILAGGVGKNGSTVADTSILSPLIPILLVIVPAYTMWQKSLQKVYENHPVLYIMAFGMVSVKITSKLVVAHMTKSEMTKLDTVFIGPAMLFLNQYFNFFITEHYVLWMCLIWATVDSMRYCSFVCIEICDHMNIYLFKITPSLSPQDGSRNHASEGSDSVPVSSSWGNTSPSTSPPRTRSRSKQIPTHTDVHQNSHYSGSAS